MMLRLLQVLVLCLSLSLCLAENLYAQNLEEQEDVEYDGEFNTGPAPRGGYRHLIQAEISSPHNLANEANSRAFDGIASLQLGYAYQTLKGLYLGGVVRYTGFNIYLPPAVPGATEGSSVSDINNHFLSFGPSLSYLISGVSGVGFMPEVSGGLTTLRYDGIKIAKYDNGFLTRSISEMSWFVSLRLQLLFTPFEDKHTHFSFFVGGTYFGHEFKKEPLGLNGDDNLIALSDNGGSLQLHVGLGFFFLLGKKN